LNPALIGGQGDAEMPKLRLRCHGRRSSFRQQMEIEMTTQPGAEKASTALGEAKEMQLAPLKIGKFLTSAELKVELWAGGWGESGWWLVGEEWLAGSSTRFTGHSLAKASFPPLAPPHPLSPGPLPIPAADSSLHHLPN